MTHKQVVETMPSNALGVWALNLLKAAASQRESPKSKYQEHEHGLGRALQGNARLISISFSK